MPSASRRGARRNDRRIFKSSDGARNGFEPLEGRLMFSAVAAVAVAATAGLVGPIPSASGGIEVNGLTANYFNHSNLKTPAVTRVDATIDFDWGAGSPDPAVKADNFGVIWTGQIQPQFSQKYTFYTRGDDGMRLWVNGKQIINDWHVHPATERSGAINLVAGQNDSIRLDFFEHFGVASASLSWSSASQPKEVVPQNVLFTTGPATAPVSTTPTTPTTPAPAGASPVLAPSPIPVISTPGVSVPPVTAPGAPPGGPITVPITTAPVGVGAVPLGHVYNVSPTGALRTIMSAVNLALPGDTIDVAPGTYHEQMYFAVSGTQQQPITVEAVTPGTVTIDGTGYDRVIAFSPGQYITLKGITVNGAANGPATAPAAVSTNSGWVLQDFAVNNTDGVGLSVYGQNVTLTRVTADDNGRQGISGDGCSNVLVQNCVTVGNNTKGNDPDFDAGAGKWTQTDHVTVDGLVSHDNIGPGLWFDYNNTNIAVENSRIYNNKGAAHDYSGTGLRLELNLGPTTITNNTFYGNTGDHIQIESCRGVTATGNTFTGTSVALEDYDRGAAYTMQDIHFGGNTFANSFVRTEGGTWNATSGQAKNITFDTDTFQVPANAATPATLFNWGGTAYTSLNDVQTKLSFEANGTATTTP